jgi:asparagine synthase (glutamine-hydrolysing)
MCGISGELRFDGQRPSRVSLQAMLAKLERRGPDNEGSYFQDALALGHRRLSIIDLSERSNQPMLDDEHELSLVFNGTIYNYPALRKELQSFGHRFKSEGDSEVILKAYAEWGVNCLQRLHGMFVFAIWDNRKKKLFLARDRVGIKPLYFSLNKNRLLFASTTQAILAGDKSISNELDPLALHNLFSLHAVVPAPRTVLQEIQKVQPAHYMLFDANGNVEEHRYWTLQATRPRHAMGEEEWVDAIHTSLKQAVHRRKTIADVPVGVLLSGGIDSSLLVALLNEAGVSGLKTYSVGFEDHPDEKGDEFEYSDLVADTFGTDHHRFVVPNSEVLPRLPEAFANMTEPMFGQDAIAFYLLSEVVSKEIKVVQSGQGADEVFGGYFWYPRMHHSTKTGINRFSDEYFDRTHDEYLEMMSRQYHVEDYTSALIEEKLNGFEADEYIDRVLALDVTTLIVDDPVKRVDNMTMAWGLEARVPFLDQNLIELAAKMPAKYKLPNGGKHVLKRISRGLLPDKIIDRSKAYFPMPALKFIEGEYLEFMREILLNDRAKSRGLYNSTYVEKLLKRPEDYYTRLQGSKLWHLAALELWLQQNIDNK